MPKLASLIITLALFSSYAIRVFADAIIEARGTSIQEWKKSKKRALLKFHKERGLSNHQNNVKSRRDETLKLT
jgi:hypothetical protein